MYTPDPARYARMTYRRCGESGLKLPRISLGLWHNFGAVDRLDNQRAMLRRAFDLGVTHFDAANNYGPPAGAAEENLGRLLASDFAAHRDELIISTKAGYRMWDGPYGEWGSRKYLLASLDQSLKRLGLKYVDIFYHHCPDPETPLEESIGALVDAVRSGRALYAGVSNYNSQQTRKAADLLAGSGVKLLIHQPIYNMFDRGVEQDLLPTLNDLGVGCIPFSPLANGLLTNRYIAGTPADSRAARAGMFFQPNPVTSEARIRLGDPVAAAAELHGTITALSKIAQARNATLAQLAVLWILRRVEITTVLIGASKVSQIEDIHGALSQPALCTAEIGEIERVLSHS